jgi:hypothetical protein
MFVYDLKSLWCERKVGTHEGTTDTTDATKKEAKESIAAVLAGVFITPALALGHYCP